MVVLRAIGRFFARIGRWIKDTAWIQPLLIVGGIFAIIFSIPYLTKWVKSWFNEESASEKYFSSKKLSLKNADKDQGKSEADDLFRYLDAYSKDEQTADQEKKFGKKFFIIKISLVNINRNTVEFVNFEDVITVLFIHCTNEVNDGFGNHTSLLFLLSNTRNLLSVEEDVSMGVSNT